MSETDKLLEEVNKTAHVKNTHPSVRKAAEENNIDLTEIKGTGRNGAITFADFKRDTGIDLSNENAKRDRQEDTRSSNHKLLQRESVSIGGMEFDRNSRSDFDHSSRLKLDIPQHLKNNELYYRWFDADEARISNAQENGYRTVDPAHFPEDERIAVERIVGTQKNGATHKQILMATPKKWVEDRHRRKEQHRREIERGMMQKPQDEKGQDLGNEYYNAHKAAQKRM